MLPNECKSEFCKVFNGINAKHHRYRVFSDFCMMAACSIQNAFLKSEEIEERYLKVAANYSKDELIKFSTLFAITTLALEEPSDFLGSIFMELGLGSSHTGQFFTPYVVSYAMAEMTFDENSIATIKKNGFVTVSDPAIGAGSTIIAFTEVVKSRKLNPQECVWVSGVDIDPTAAAMAYIQLSLLGIPGEIVVGNSLSMQFEYSYKTPMHYVGDWESRFRLSRMFNKIKGLFSSGIRTGHEKEGVLEDNSSASRKDDILFRDISSFGESIQLGLF